MTVGYRVLVCDNMAFSGDFTPVLAIRNVFSVTWYARRVRGRVPRNWIRSVSWRRRFDCSRKRTVSELETTPCEVGVLPNTIWEELRDRQLRWCFNRILCLVVLEKAVIEIQLLPRGLVRDLASTVAEGIPETFGYNDCVT